MKEQTGLLRRVYRWKTSDAEETTLDDMIRENQPQSSEEVNETEEIAE